MQSESIETNDPIVKRLRALARERPDLKDAARVFEAVLPLVRDADLRGVPLSLSSEDVREKLEEGIPLLSGLDLELDEQAASDLMLRLARSIEKIGNMQNPGESGTAALPEGDVDDADKELSMAAGRVRLALEEDKIDIDALLSHVAGDDSDFIESIAGDMGLDPGLLRMLAGNVLKPAMAAWRRQLAPLVADVQWDKVYCFICGADATLGELREDGQVMHLRCAQCGADWQVRRLRCVFCGNEDHRTLSCLYSDKEREKMRVEVCDKCRGYLKVITSFSPTPPEMLPVEDLATLHLDYIAQERGYVKTDIKGENSKSSTGPSSRFLPDPPQ